HDREDRAKSQLAEARHETRPDRVGRETEMAGDEREREQDDGERRVHGGSFQRVRRTRGEGIGTTFLRPSGVNALPCAKALSPRSTAAKNVRRAASRGGTNAACSRSSSRPPAPSIARRVSSTVATTCRRFQRNR